MYTTRNLLGLAGICLMLSLCGCEIPGGASVPDTKLGRYAVHLPYKEVDFTAAPAAQTVSGVSVTVMADAIVPSLYYGYDVSSRVNGSYAFMPNPPLIYTVRKVPFYKTDSDVVTLHIDLQNTIGDVVRAGQAVCSVDIDGKTVTSAPLGAEDLMPGHSLSLQIQGPGSEQFGTKMSGTMTVWLYGLSADKNQALHWDLGYTVKEQDTQAWGEVVGETPSAEEANRFKGKVEPAGPEDLVPATPPGG